jgi:hypothetical protein
MLSDGLRAVKETHPPFFLVAKRSAAAGADCFAGYADADFSIRHASVTSGEGSARGEL